MHLPSRYRLIRVALGAVLAFLSVARAADTGSVTGQVSNGATKMFLEGAVVTVAGTDLSTTTDREGRYQLGGIAATDVTLVVSFTGLDPKRVPVRVPAGQSLRQDFELTS